MNSHIHTYVSIWDNGLLIVNRNINEDASENDKPNNDFAYSKAITIN